MPESEEDLRRFLRQEVAQQRQDVEQARWWRRRFQILPWLDTDYGVTSDRLTAPDPLFGDLEVGQGAETGLDESSSGPDTSAAPATGAPVAGATLQPAAAAPVLPPPKAAVVAGPAPAQGPSVREITRALAVFGAVTALGAGALFAQRSLGDLKVWLFVAVAMLVCAVLFIGAGRSLAPDRHSSGNPPIVS